MVIFAAKLVLKACSKVEIDCLRFHKRRSFWSSRRLMSRWMCRWDFFKLFFNFINVRQACSRYNSWLNIAFLPWYSFLFRTNHLIKLQGKSWFSFNTNELVWESIIRRSWLALHELFNSLIFFRNCCLLCSWCPTTTVLKLRSLLLSPREWKHAATSSILWCCIISRWNQRLHLLFLTLFFCKWLSFPHVCKVVAQRRIFFFCPKTASTKDSLYSSTRVSTFISTSRCCAICLKIIADFSIFS